MKPSAWRWRATTAMHRRHLPRFLTLVSPTPSGCTGPQRRASVGVAGTGSPALWLRGSGHCTPAISTAKRHCHGLRRPCLTLYPQRPMQLEDLVCNPSDARDGGAHTRGQDCGGVQEPHAGLVLLVLLLGGIGGSGRGAAQDRQRRLTAAQHVFLGGWCEGYLGSVQRSGLGQLVSCVHPSE